jgi:hypothetical protein
VTDKYLTREQVVCFQELLKFSPLYFIERIDKTYDEIEAELDIVIAIKSLEKLFLRTQIKKNVRQILNVYS